MLALCGDLGSGKTTFVQGVAEGLGVSDAVASPTFVLVREYQGRLPLYHMDFFRLERPADLEAEAFGEYVTGRGVTLVEWAQKMREVLPKDRMEFSFVTAGMCLRAIEAIPHGARAEALLDALRGGASHG